MNNCLSCGKETENIKYCSIKCQIQHQRDKRKSAFLNEEYVGKPLLFRTGEWTRDIIIETYGNKCNKCGISDWNGKDITLEVNHVDGKALNNRIENLELLCPNCHSQTETYKAKNYGNSDRNKKRRIKPM